VVLRGLARPERRFAVLVATNIAGGGAEAACDEMAAAMFQKHRGQ